MSLDKLLKAGMISLALLSPAYASEPKPALQTVETVKTPSYDEYKALLVKKGKLNKLKEDALRSFWNKLNDKTKTKYFQREQNPKEYLEKYIDPKARAIYSDTQLTAEEAKSLEFFSFWNVNPEKDLSDRIYFYELRDGFRAIGNSTGIVPY